MLDVAVIGVGVAGRARVRALQGHPGARLVAVHRGRFAGEAGAPEVDAEEVLQVADVVIICSPSETHAGWVEAALQADRHVVVEYAISRGAAEARRLFGLARARGLVLHVEHIERLAPSTLWLAERVAEEGWVEGSLSFESAGEPWADGATHAWHNESRLHRLVQVLGWPESVDVEAVDGRKLLAEARWSDGRGVRLAFTRGAGSRGLDLTVRTSSGVRQIAGRGAFADGVAVTLPERALFRADLDHALARIAGTAGPYVADDEVAAILDLAEVLGAGPGSRCVKPA